MLKNILLSISIVFLFIGCGSTGNQYMVPHHQSIPGSSIAILPIDIENFYSFDVNHTFGAFNEVQKGIFNSNASVILARNTSGEVKGVMEHVESDADFEIRELELGRDKIKIMAPVAGSSVSNGSGEPTYVLIFDQYRFHQFTRNDGASSYAGHEEGALRRFLAFETKYAIWDNVSKELVAWGVVNSDQQYTNNVTENDYTELLNKAMRQIISRSPFVGP
jgi:hypothetical protein